MKTLTTIFTIACFSIITNKGLSQTGYINTKSVFPEAINTIATSAGQSIKMNTMGIAQGIIKVKMVNQPKGSYSVQLLNSDGVVLSTQVINHEEGTSSEIVQFGKSLPGGMYQVELTSPDNTKTTEKVMLLM